MVGNFPAKTETHEKQVLQYPGYVDTIELSCINVDTVDTYKLRNIRLNRFISDVKWYIYVNTVKYVNTVNT